MNTARQKSESCTNFKTSFAVTKNITKNVFFLLAAPVKNRHKMHYHREFTCKRDITLAGPRSKFGCCFGYKYICTFCENVCCKYFLFLVSFIFMQIKSSLMPF